MSYKIVDEVLKHSKSKGAARLVLIVLASHADDKKREAWPSLDTIRNEAGLTERGACKALALLEDDLHEIRRDSTNGGRNCQTHYFIEPFNSEPYSEFTDRNSEPRSEETLNAVPKNSEPRSDAINRHRTVKKTVSLAQSAKRTARKADAAAGKETDPRIKELMTYFHDKHLARVGEKILLGGKDAKLFQDMLKAYPADQIKRMLDSFFASNHKFILDAGYTVGVFHSQIPKLLLRPEVKPQKKTEAQIRSELEREAEWECRREKQIPDEAENILCQMTRYSGKQFAPEAIKPIIDLLRDGANSIYCLTLIVRLWWEWKDTTPERYDPAVIFAPENYKLYLRALHEHRPKLDARAA
jgi:hypothetical protein